MLGQMMKFLLISLLALNIAFCCQFEVKKENCDNNIKVERNSLTNKQVIVILINKSIFPDGYVLKSSKFTLSINGNMISESSLAFKVKDGNYEIELTKTNDKAFVAEIYFESNNPHRKNPDKSKVVHCGTQYYCKIQI
jgi:hypothetical protein